MPLRPSALAALASLILLAACGPSASSPDGAAQPADALHGRVAAHWFGRQWPKNYLSGFRREHVAELADEIRSRREPTNVSMGSPGTRRIRKNANSVMPKKVGMIRLKRVNKKRSMGWWGGEW